MKRHRYTDWKSVARSTQRSLRKVFGFSRKSQNEQIIMCTVSNFHLQQESEQASELGWEREEVEHAQNFTETHLQWASARAKNNNKWNVWLCSCMLCSLCVYFCVHFQRKILNLLITHTHFQFPSTLCHSWLSEWERVCTREFMLNVNQWTMLHCHI